MGIMAKTQLLKKYYKLLGPGLLYAGAAIGVSHLVQSTRAGADFGFELMWIVFAANLLKFPFFEIGSRYTLATGKNLLDAYYEAGKWILLLFFIITLISVFPIQAALTLVTAGLLANVLGTEMSAQLVSSILVLATLLFLMSGKAKILDRMIKIVILLLTISTLIAVVGALNLPQRELIATQPFDILNKTHLLFLIAFIGWMPAPIDIVVWTSLWSQNKYKNMTEKPDLKAVLIEFRIGYFGTMLIAAAFLALGALVMYGTGVSVSPSGAVFAGQLINMYTSTIGSWAYVVIAVAALSTMLSTTITVTDVYPRTLALSMSLLFPGKRQPFIVSKYLFWLVVLSVGVVLLIWFSGSSMRFMVDFATSVSFVTAPILAVLNYKVIMAPAIDKAFQPPLYLRIWSWIGITFLTVFTIIYIYSLIFIQ